MHPVSALADNLSTHLLGRCLYTLCTYCAVSRAGMASVVGGFERFFQEGRAGTIRTAVMSQLRSQRQRSQSLQPYCLVFCQGMVSYLHAFHPTQVFRPADRSLRSQARAVRCTQTGTTRGTIAFHSACISGAAALEQALHQCRNHSLCRCPHYQIPAVCVGALTTRYLLWNAVNDAASNTSETSYIGVNCSTCRAR